ncbi:MAG: serine hydrolase [Pseudomonadota bacterium]
MKRSLLYLTLMAFLAGAVAPGPVAWAASSTKTTVKSQSASKAKAKTKKKTKAKTKKKLKSKQKAKVVARAPTPLRAAAGATAVGAVTTAGAVAGDLHELNLKSAAALVIDQKTGEALYAKNADIPTSIASITKLMTAMVTLDAGLSMDEEITINSADVDRLKGTTSRLALGTTLTRGELMHLALIASENRAASALSRAYPGGRDAFIAAMNRKARALGMTDSHFVDSTGLNSANKATASDLARMVDAAYRYPAIRDISTAAGFDVVLPAKKVVKIRENGRIKRVTRDITRQVAFTNTNALTRNGEWDIGVSKTGYINEAGRCLVMQARISEKPVIIVLLDSWGKWSRIGDANRIKKWLEERSHLVSRGNQDSV